MKTTLIILAVLVTVTAGFMWFSSRTQSDPRIVARQGIHWHPELSILVKGEPVVIPENIGIGPQYARMRGYDTQMRMAAMHTHDDLPLIHMEFAHGPVYREDTTLGQFFALWGRDMRSFGTNMRMTVNGVENTEYESYEMHDGDRIELQFD